MLVGAKMHFGAGPKRRVYYNIDSIWYNIVYFPDEWQSVLFFFKKCPMYENGRDPNDWEITTYI